MNLFKIIIYVGALDLASFFGYIFRTGPIPIPPSANTEVNNIPALPLFQSFFSLCVRVMQFVAGGGGLEPILTVTKMAGSSILILVEYLKIRKNIKILFFSLFKH
jgi:hypothetical protein